MKYYYVKKAIKTLLYRYFTIKQKTYQLASLNLVLLAAPINSSNISHQRVLCLFYFEVLKKKNNVYLNHLSLELHVMNVGEKSVYRTN
jgi:hypothetical protein